MGDAATGDGVVTAVCAGIGSGCGGIDQQPSDGSGCGGIDQQNLWSPLCSWYPSSGIAQQRAAACTRVGMDAQ